MPEQRPAPVSVLAGLAQQGSTSITGRSATAHEGTRSPVVVLGPELEPHVNSRDSPLTLGDHSSLQDTTEMSPRHFAPNTISHAEKGVEAAVQQHHQFTWFTFPAEIRNMIYDLLLHWPDCRELYGGFYKELDAYYFRRKGCRHEFPSFERQLRTPTILLLCKSITEECMPMLKSRWLVIDRVPPFQAGDTGPIPISQFIGRRTLQSVVHIDIRIGLGEGNLGSGWIWVKILDQLLEILSERNSFRDLRLLIRLCNVDNYNIWREEFRIYEDIMRKVCES